MNKFTAIRAGVSFCCYTPPTSPKKDETAVLRLQVLACFVLPIILVR